jgi:hypothetical protein
VTTWFSPYQAYLFGNTQERLDGRQVAAYVPDYVERTRRLSQGLPVFVDQFNFRHFGGPQGESALGGENEELEFVSSALPSLLRASLGYALWNYQDYYLNIIYNGSFRFGLADWETPGEQPGAEVIGRDQQHSEVEMQPGSWIRQQVSVYPDQQYTLEFNAEGPGQSLEVQIDFPDTQQSLSSSFHVLKEMQTFQWKLKTPRQDSKLAITFRPSRSSQPIRIGDILLYPWIDTGGIYTVERHPRRELRDLFRKINLSVR